MLTQCNQLLRRELRVCVVFALAATALGCASDSKKWKFADWDAGKAAFWKKDDEKPEPEVPIRLVATWTETVLNQAGQKPKRGFGGRIAFFKRESEDPIRVDGQLVVYAFDETSREDHETHPTKKFIFPAEEFVRHESDSALGPAYSFWLPWDEVGGQQKNISLIARFEPKGGPIVIGEQTRHFLPGAALDPSRPQLAQDGASDVVNAVRLAAYAKQAEAAVPELAPSLADEVQQGRPADGRPRMSTSTINLPPHLSTAMNQPRAESNTTTLDIATTRDVPLSQLSAMRREQRAAGTPATESPASVEPETADAAELPDEPAAASARSPVLDRTPLRAIATGREAASGSLHGSLRETRRAPSTRSEPRGLDRAR